MPKATLPLEAEVCDALVINAPQFFEDPAFVAWVNDATLRKFTWHYLGQPLGEWSDVILCVDPGLTGEGPDSDMPEHIWDQIVATCRSKFSPRRGAPHIQVRLTNLRG